MRAPSNHVPSTFVNERMKQSVSSASRATVERRFMFGMEKMSRCGVERTRRHSTYVISAQRIVARCGRGLM